MNKWIEVTGKNEEAAISSALDKLGMERDDVSVEVLERARKGMFGIGSSPARIKVSYEVPDEIPAKESPKVEPKKVEQVAPPKKEMKKQASKVAPIKKDIAKPAQAKPVQAKPVHERVPAPVAEAVSKEAPKAKEKVVAAAPGEVEARINEFLLGLMAQMEFVAVPKITIRSPGVYLVVLEGEKLGMLIGHRGETLDAIQQLCNYAVNRGRSGRVRIHIDAENYRLKREDVLRRLAERVAEKVIKYRRNVTLEPMNAYERHVIHEALQDSPDVVTYSTGNEPNRRTVVAYNKGKHPY